jgi:uncharacterized RDD family membrane protein YckC
MSDEYFASPPAVGTTQGNPAPIWELSGWWRRVGASTIDSLLLFIPITILVEASGLGPDPAPDDYSLSANLDLVGMILYLVSSSVYFMWTMSAWNGQTVGKRVTGIRVVKEDGTPVTAGFAFTRQTLVIGVLFGWLAILLLYIPTFLNYLWPLWDDKNQALHDKIVKSRVVREQPATDPGSFQVAQQQQAPFPVGAPPAPYAPPGAPVAPTATPFPPAPSAPPPPPAPGGTSTPYSPPPGFENPVPEDEEK